MGGGDVERVEIFEVLGTERVWLVGEEHDVGLRRLHLLQREDRVARRAAAHVLAAAGLEHVVGVGIRANAHVRFLPDRDEQAWRARPFRPLPQPAVHTLDGPQDRIASGRLDHSGELPQEPDGSFNALRTPTKTGTPAAWIFSTLSLLFSSFTATTMSGSSSSRRLTS